MSSKAQVKVFTPFFTTRPGDGGSGVGLAYSKRLVEIELGGGIAMAATLKSGTRFVIDLPIDPSKAGLAQTKGNRVSGGAGGGGGLVASLALSH